MSLNAVTITYMTAGHHISKYGCKSSHVEYDFKQSKIWSLTDCGHIYKYDQTRSNRRFKKFRKNLREISRSKNKYDRLYYWPNAVKFSDVIINFLGGNFASQILWDPHYKYDCLNMTDLKYGYLRSYLKSVTISRSY